VLALGIAGALSPSLPVGEMLVSSEVMEGDVVLSWPDLQWLDDANIQRPYDLGRLVTVDEILSTPEQKAEWWGRTVRDQPAAADMESACYARVAISYGLPYLICRYVSDSAAETLPGFLEDCRGQDGAIDTRQVFWKAFWRPSTWRTLWRLRRRLQVAAERLADFAEDLVGSLAVPPPTRPSD